MSALGLVERPVRQIPLNRSFRRQRYQTSFYLGFVNSVETDQREGAKVRILVRQHDQTAKAETMPGECSGPTKKRAPEQ